LRTFVVDASVAAKWMRPAKGELGRAEAFRLLDADGAGEVGPLVPDIFWAECRNIVGKAVRQRRFSRADAELAMLSMVHRAIPTISSAKLLSEALAIAFNFGRSLYDSPYVALAVQAESS
jgi:predicted nucleic acid-binding protein